jgi:hypothetical protein
MKVATRDRGQVIHQAGFHRLSPGLRQGRPVLLAEGDGPGRTGWAPFLAAMEAAGLALAWEPDVPGTAALVPLAEARPLERRAGLAEGLAHCRRFLRALLREAPPPGTGS